MFLRKLKYGIIAVVLVMLIVGCSDDDSGDNSGDDSSVQSYTIGILDVFGSPAGLASEGLQERMSELGYVAGENVTYIPGDNQLEDPAGALLGANPDIDLIFCSTTNLCLSAQQATSEIPIVFVLVSDPIGSGLVESFTDPGGNVTGVASVAPNSSNEGKRLEWLLEIDPSIERVWIPYNPDEATIDSKVEAVQTTADNSGIELVYTEIRTAEEVDAAFANIPEDIDAVFQFSQRVFTIPQLQALTAATIEQNLPYAAPGVDFGALMAYSSSVNAMGIQAAVLADKILRGAAPSELPVETPEFFLSIHLVTAESIGLEVPDGVLRQADTIVRE